MYMPLSSRLIFTVIGVTLPIAAHLADMSLVPSQDGG
jgi:hypothetical protein